MRRERDTIFLRWLLLHRQLSTQSTRGSRRAQSRLAWPRSESQLSRKDVGTQLTAFSQIPQNISPRFRCVTSLTSPGHNCYLRFLFWYLWMTHPLHARVNTCAHVFHLTNPCTEPKGSHPTKKRRKPRYTKRNPFAIILHTILNKSCLAY